MMMMVMMMTMMMMMMTMMMMMMMMMMMIWIIWKMEMEKLCREICTGVKTFLFTNVLIDIGRSSKCCAKLGIIHQIDSKKGLDHFVNYSAQIASRLTYMQVDIQKKT